MKITFDEICDTRDNPGAISFSEHQRILKGAIEMIKQLEKRLTANGIETDDILSNDEAETRQI